MVAPLVAVCLIPLIGALALAIDAGLIMAERRRVQATADASALAAAGSIYKVISGGGTANSSTGLSAAQQLAVDNGYDSTAVALHYPPTSGTFSGQAGYVEVLVTSSQPKYFSALWGAGTVPVVARSVAEGTVAPYSPDALIVLDPSASGALTVAGGAQVVATSTVQVNSSSSTAVNANNSGVVDAPTIAINGSYTTSSSGQLIGSVVTGAPSFSDPLASLAAPSTSGLTSQSTSLTGYGARTISPGIYGGGLTIGGGQTITMNPGVYYMQNGGFTVANGASVTGSGVLIYTTGTNAGISFQGGASAGLTPPTSGTYAGIVLWVDKSSNGTIDVANGSATTITGTVYAPNAAATFAGGAPYNQFGSQYIVKTLNVSDDAYVGISYSSGNVARQRAIHIVE